MKIERIELEEFRRFQKPFVLDDLQPGLNVFVGSNEAGKSTVAAALRAAFLERFKTKAVANLAPWGMSQARPTITLDFRIGDTRYRLCKSFLTRPRCDLSVDGGSRRFEGEDAEDMLAQLLGFHFAGKGQSKPEHAGIPGLLWITQGDSQQLLGPAEYAASHLRDALTRLSGEFAASDGDRLFDRVAAERGELLDPRGRAKGALRQAEDALTEATSRCAQLLLEKQALDADVDKLLQWQVDYQRCEREQAWQGFEQKAEQARARLAAAGKAREQLDSLTREAAQQSANHDLLQDRITRDRNDLQTLETLSSHWDEARSAAEHASLALTAAEHQRDECEWRAVHARTQREAMAADTERRDLAERSVRQQAETDRLATNLAQAESSMLRTQQLARESAESAMAKADLDGLRVAEQELAQKIVQQQTVATQVRYALSAGQQLRVDGEVVSGEGQISVIAATEIDIASVGRLTIVPGGPDLPTIAGVIDSIHRERDRLLARIGAADAREAEAKWVAFDRAERDLELAKKELALYAPVGIDGLRAQHRDAVNHQAVLAQRQRDLPLPGQVTAGLFDPMADHSVADQAVVDQRAVDQRAVDQRAVDQAAASDGPTPSFAAAVRMQEHAEGSLAKARDALATATTRADTTRALAQVLGGQLEPLKRALQDPAEEGLRTHRQAQLAQAAAAVAALSRRVDDAKTTLGAHQPELAQQDVQRFDQSARIVREGHRAKQRDILQLQGKLEQAGATGVGERLVDAQATQERTTRRAAELGTRAAALDLLATMLQEQRQAATRRLAAPLAHRLRHYIPLVFPTAELRLDDTLAPAALARGDVLDTLESLSFGTREQLGVLTRLAYADLLQQAGRPTLIVLDDALVHTDDARREFMKRALFDAASRHQILMFTCHADAWQDLGVVQRQLQ
jgi:hypothetical protein